MANHLADNRGIHPQQSHVGGFSVTALGPPSVFFAASFAAMCAHGGISHRLRNARALLFSIIVTGPGLCACDAARTPEPSRSPPPSAVAPPVASPPPTADSGRSPPSSPPAANAGRAETLSLLSLPTSAYQAPLAVDDDAAYLLTNHAAHRLVPGRAPKAFELDLGFGSTATRHGLVFWSEGAVREASKLSGESRRLAALAARPQLFVSSGDDLAWLERSDDKLFSLRSLTGSRVTTAYTSTGTIDAVAMLSDWIFFVERPAGAEWRIGGVPAKGGTPVFTSARRGRAPAMLVAHHELYYYDGNGREVRRLSPDLRDEETLVSDFVCSPLAVAERVYCANVEGIFELVPHGRPRPLVELTRGGTVTDLAANATHVFWVSDAGADKLSVHALALGPAPSAPPR